MARMSPNVVPRTAPRRVQDRLYVGMRERADRVLSLHLGAAEGAGP